MVRVSTVKNQLKSEFLKELQHICELQIWKKIKIRTIFQSWVCHSWSNPCTRRSNVRNFRASSRHIFNSVVTWQILVNFRQNCSKRVKLQYFSLFSAYAQNSTKNAPLTPQRGVTLVFKGCEGVQWTQCCSHTSYREQDLVSSWSREIQNIWNFRIFSKITLLDTPVH